jgi:dihydroorotase/N-acyl-D-amino-acid deacylase
MKRVALVQTRFALLALGFTIGCAQQRGSVSPADRVDLLITGGTIIDGTGAASFTGDVAVRDGRIVSVSRRPLSPTTAERVIDASGRVVAPGFIDLHVHAERLLEHPESENYLRQGVTTITGNPDGGWLPHRRSPWPLGPYLDSVANTPLVQNVAYWVGHSTVRREVLGMSNRNPDAAELIRMQAMVARAMGEGAFGLSTGLNYVPAVYAGTDEIVSLARVSADSGGIYISHIRDEGPGLLASVAEAIEIGRRARLPVVIDHHKALGTRSWGASVRSLEMIDTARSAGIDVMVNQYPYTAAATSIAAMLPAWSLAGGDSAFSRRLAIPHLRDSIVKGIVGYVEAFAGGDLKRIQFARVTWMKPLEGRTLHEWATSRGMPATPASAAELALDVMQRGGATAIYHFMSDDDVERIMRHPVTMIASDGELTFPGDAQIHPRSYGTFARVLAQYVREKKVLTLEDAVRRMTSLPASRLRLRDRGVITNGGAADLVVFDPASVADRATFAEPHQFATGFDYVIVNGVVAVSEGRRTAATGGQLLRRRAATAAPIGHE